MLYRPSHHRTIEKHFNKSGCRCYNYSFLMRWHSQCYVMPWINLIQISRFYRCQQHIVIYFLETRSQSQPRPISNSCDTATASKGSAISVGAFRFCLPLTRPFLSKPLQIAWHHGRFGAQKFFMLQWMLWSSDQRSKGVLTNLRWGSKWWHKRYNLLFPNLFIDMV